jgi:hypothetical protein
MLQPFLEAVRRMTRLKEIAVPRLAARLAYNQKMAVQEGTLDKPTGLEKPFNFRTSFNRAEFIGACKMWSGCSNPECKKPFGYKNSELSKCAKCKKARYCNKDCQKEDWKSWGHKELCSPGPKPPGELKVIAVLMPAEAKAVLNSAGVARGAPLPFPLSRDDVEGNFKGLLEDLLGAAGLSLVQQWKRVERQSRILNRDGSVAERLRKNTGQKSVVNCYTMHAFDSSSLGLEIEDDVLLVVPGLEIVRNSGGITITRYTVVRFLQRIGHRIKLDPDGNFEWAKIDYFREGGLQATTSDVVLLLWYEDIAYTKMHGFDIVK